MSEPRVRVVEGGVEIDVPNDHPRGALVLESEPPRIRIALDGATLAWARILRFGAGFSWTRLPRRAPLAIVAPIRSRDAREIDAWPLAFAHMLIASGRAWIAPGTWSLAGLVRHRDTFVSLDGFGSTVRGLESALDAPSSIDERHRLYGSGRVLVLRESLDPDAARVRSWRKHARERTLPPIMLGWLSALDAYVILDGHDRLRAALLENVTPDVVALVATREVRAPLDEVSRDVVREKSRSRYALGFANEPRLSDRSRHELNQHLVVAYDDWSYRSAATPARYRRDLASLARRELAADDPILRAS